MAPLAALGLIVAFSLPVRGGVKHLDCAPAPAARASALVAAMSNTDNLANLVKSVPRSTSCINF